MFCNLSTSSSFKKIVSIKPNIINEKITNIETITVDEAIMKMNLANLPALVFVNIQSKHINVVYHRKDCNISLIDLKTGY